jgi:NitT/TauT family transport system ATP-binding protein
MSAAAAPSPGSPETSPASAHLEVNDLRIAYTTSDGNGVVAVDGMTMNVKRGEFVCLLGPSGCGKSTTLMAMAGLLKPTSGTVSIAGRPVTGPGPDRAVVFQEFALMPWLTVLDNVCFGMRMRGVPSGERQARARDYIKLVGLTGFENAYPHQLSGGMRQRVGIARALAVQPEIILMDEPFGALDAQTREIMGVELLQIWERDRKTVLFVTHGIDEAIYLADRVVVMAARPGRIREEITIDIPRPRAHSIHESSKFIELRRYIWELLGQSSGAGGSEK